MFKHNLRFGLLALLLFVTVVVWYVAAVESRDGKLTVAFLDVGQGDAIFIEAPNGRQVLIDGGANRSVLQALGEVIPFYDRSIDMVMATHPDLDHIGGLPAVFRSFSVAQFVESGVVTDSAAYETLQAVVSAEGSQLIEARRGMRFVLGEVTFLDILFPDRDVSALAPNDASVIARLVHGETSFLLMGDSPQKIEEFLVRIDAAGLQADVLKVGHHGSKTSSTESFVGAVVPTMAVVSSGEDNRYGHPHQSVLDTFEQFGVEVLRTDMLGTIIFESDGERVNY